MPLQRDGPCPFKGFHWPEWWGDGIEVNKKTFHLLEEDQRKDLIEYFYLHQNTKSQKIIIPPAYKFTLNALRDYFGQHPNVIRIMVLSSDEYKAYAEERSLPPPPPEMSLLTRDLIARCRTLDPPPSIKAEGAHAWERAQGEGASAAQVVRIPERARAGIHTSEGLPDKDGNYVDGNSEKKVLNFDEDPNRILACNMLDTFAEAAEPQFGKIGEEVPTGSASAEDIKIWVRLVKHEESQDRVPAEEAARPGNQKKYRARAVKGLIQLLASVFWYLSGHHVLGGALHK